MVACAILFSYSFDYQRYNMENEQKMSIAQSVKHMMTMTDVKTNIMERLRGKGTCMQTIRKLLVNIQYIGSSHFLNYEYISTSIPY